MKTLAFMWLVTLNPTPACLEKDKAESFQTVLVNVPKSTATAVSRLEVKQRIKTAPTKNFSTIVTFRDAKGKVTLPKIDEGAKILGGWPKSCFKIQATRFAGKVFKLK